jgi:hypothetical protein
MKPSVVLCEFEDRKTLPLGHTYHDIANYLRGWGYEVIVSEWYPIAEYGQTHRWRRAVRYPVDLDPYAWGNLLAVRPFDLSRAMRAMRAAATRWRFRQVVDKSFRSPSVMS